jgi:hypothetical protein
MKPHPVVVKILRAMTGIIPTWKIVPTNDVIDAAYKTQEKRDEIRNNPYCYKDKPRLKTAFELLKVSLDLEANILHQVRQLHAIFLSSFGLVLVICIQNVEPFD